jgi:hypothetical protein
MAKKMNKEFDHIRNQTIGTVEYVSPREIKVLLEINAPQNTSINTGVPQLFPKVNGYILIPNESGVVSNILCKFIKNREIISPQWR